MEGQDLTALRRIRAVRKGKLTIALNELHAELKEEDIVPEQIRQLLDKAKTRLDIVEDAHDKLVDVIVDEEQLPKEEDWLSSVVREFNQIARRARKTLSELDKTLVKPAINNVVPETPAQVESVENVPHHATPNVNTGPTNSDDALSNVTNVTNDPPTGNHESVSNTNEIVTNVEVTNCTDDVNSVPGSFTATQESSLISMVQAMALPKAQVAKFNGEPLFYHPFIASFNNSVSCILDPSVKLNVLRSLCCGRALEAIEHCVLKPTTEGFQAALATLKKRFGNSAVIVQAWIQKIVNRPRVELPKLEGYADDLTNCYQALDTLGFLHELSNQGSLKVIIDRLPKFLQQRWTREVFRLREKDQVPSLKNVVKFVRSSACEVNDPVFGTVAEVNATRATKVPERSSGHRVLQTDARVNPKWKRCWACETDDHWPDQCPALLQLTPDERMRKVKEKRVCFSCLKRAGKGHSMNTCRRRRKCMHCDSFHHPLLHVVAVATTGQIMTVNMNSSFEEADVVMPMLTAKVSYRESNVMFDTCATLTLVRDEFAKVCQFPSKPITVEITTLGGEKSLLHTRAYKMKVSPQQGNPYSLIGVGVPEIASVPKMSSNLRANVERELGEPIHRGSGAVDVLIGINYPRMHTGSCIDVGNYVTRKTPLGWVVFGADTDGVTSTQNRPVLLVNLAQPVDMSQFWSTEEMGVKLPGCECDTKDVVLSPEDNQKYDEMWQSCKKVDGKWIMPYPWVRPPVELPNNERQCYAKLCSLEKRMLKTPDSAMQYNQAIDELVERGFARRLTNKEKTEYRGPVHYIPHHAVLRAESASTPIRIVFNSSSVCNGAALNDFWHKGPDLLQNIIGVILRFRRFKFAVAGDISKMFYQVKIPLEDMHVHRFLWRNYQERAPDTYLLTTVTPGDKPAPAMAITALLKTAKENEVEHPQAAQTLQHDTYMDDICTSVKSRADVIELTKEVDQVLSTAGFRVKQWVSNVNLKEGQDCHEQGVLSNCEDQKVLGVMWEPKSDMLKYRVQQNEVDAKLTKRAVLSQVSKVFDPIGYAGAFLIRAKIMMQRLWATGVKWDDQLSPDEEAKWVQFFVELRSLNGVSFERCLIPEPDAKIMLVIFCDASEVAFGAVCYVRCEMPDGTVGVRFVTAKSRVAPLKLLTVPRLELQAAVLASRVYVSVANEMSTYFERVVFLSDSIITLCWIRGRSRQYKPFVANRVAEIQGSTDPSDWRHVPGEFNIADKVSRGVGVEDLSGEWKSGPEFLRLPEEQWPRSIPTADPSEVEKEKRKEKTVLLVKPAEVAINATKFSSWRKLVRVTAYVLRFITNVKAGCCVVDGPLSVHELKNAERYWIVEAQKMLKKLENYKSLSPFIKDGVIYVGGRIDADKLCYDPAHPVLLPRGHPICYLITRQVHETGHYGVATTDAKVRRNYWIVRGTSLAKTIKFRCTKCRAFAHKTEQQYMADLPDMRMMPYSPPFHCTAVDYFGPYEVKIGRNKTMKHYGVIFTCLNTRAVHLELAVDCSTDEFLQVLRRFYAVRGKPHLIQSDNGTQFVGAEKELRRMIQGWDKDKLKEYCAEEQVAWRFITPLAPHHNGCVEALVKSCKHALKKAVGNQRMTPFELHTCLQEVANLVNERPIGRRPNDPDDGTYLCPNDILLGRASTRVPQGPFRQTKNPRDRFAFVQKVVDAFWKTWIRDVFPLLVPRRKWNVDRRNVSVNDIIMMSEPNMVRSQWKLGRVVDVFPGVDGRVRCVKVKTAKGEYQRPVTKIVVLHPAEGFDDQV